ncbi:MAG: DNA polymerase [Candidatus Methanosuratincola sp.]
MERDVVTSENLVRGEGPKRPKLILVGEAPGEEEVREKRPFVGTDGKILNGILASAGVRREECYVTNVVKIRPPNNKIKRLGELGLTVDDFIPALKAELEALEGGVCVPLGDVALNVICGKDGITKHRGSVYRSSFLDGRELLCVPTYNPGFVREFWQARGVVVEDIKKALRIGREGYVEPRFNTLIRPTFEDVDKFFKRLKNVTMVSIDIETLPYGQIACLGLGANFPEGRASICIPFKYGYKNYWERDEEWFIWGMVRELMESEVTKLGQFISYDFTYLLPFVGEPAPPWYDINAAHHLLDPELPHTLAFLTSIYTDVPYYKNDPKDEGESWKGVTSSDQLWEYNGKDVEVPLMIEPLLTKELKEAGLWDFFCGYQMPLVRVMWRISQRGILMDEKKKSEMLRKAFMRIEKLNAELEELVGHPINVNSPKQMLKFLYEDLKLPVQYHRKTRRPTANKETLEKLFARYPNPAFKIALEIRDVAKDIGTYLKARPSEDGRYRTRYNPTGTETGRSSSTKTIFGDGLDMQNIPRSSNTEDEDEWKGKIRSLFIAGEGKVFEMWDLWQAEAYCVAVFAQCQAFLEKLMSGKKIHTMVASWIFDKPEEEISEEEYHIGKRTVHASNYGLGPILFSVLIKKPVKEAKAIMERYHRHAPEIERWHKEIQEELKRRVLVTPFGRRRIFRNRYGEEMFREAYAHLPQSTIADYLHQAMVKLEYALPKGAEIVQEGFDSLIIERDEGVEIEETVRRCFDKELFWKGVRFKIPVERKVGKRWV